MMAQTSKRTPAKGKGQGRTPPAAKGCSCKRSQCIKNYCDCYQSMMVCTEFCRCVGCRNTEERLAVEPRTPSRNSSAAKRDRSAALSAKAAAAAAKETSNNPVPLVSSTSMPGALVPFQPPPTAMAPVNMIHIAPDTFNAVLQQIPSEQFMPIEETDEVPTTPNDAQDQPIPGAMEPPGTGSNGTQNLFLPIINEAQLMCSLIQGCEAEELGLDHCQVARLAIAEFARGFKEVCEKMLNLNLEQ